MSHRCSSACSLYFKYEKLRKYLRVNCCLIWSFYEQTREYVKPSLNYATLLVIYGRRKQVSEQRCVILMVIILASQGLLRCAALQYTPGWSSPQTVEVSGVDYKIIITINFASR